MEKQAKEGREKVKIEGGKRRGGGEREGKRKAEERREEEEEKRRREVRGGRKGEVERKTAGEQGKG